LQECKPEKAKPATAIAVLWGPLPAGWPRGSTLHRAAKRLSA